MWAYNILSENLRLYIIYKMITYIAVIGMLVISQEMATHSQTIDLINQPVSPQKILGFITMPVLIVLIDD